MLERKLITSYRFLMRKVSDGREFFKGSEWFISSSWSGFLRLKLTAWGSLRNGKRGYVGCN